MTFYLAAGALYFAIFLISNGVLRLLEQRARRGIAGPA
jgi:ABC-type arginine transport system permease subunit